MSIPVKEQVRYGVLGLPLAFGGIPLYLYAPDYYGRNQGISLGLLGTLLLLLRALDAFSDPLFGWLADRQAQHRLMLNLCFAVCFALGFSALFLPPPGSGAAWFFGSVLLASAGYSFLTIQLNSLGAVRSRTENEALALNSARESFVLIGLFLAALLPAAFSLWLGERTGMGWVVAIFLGLLLVAVGLWQSWLRNIPITVSSPQENPAGYLVLIRSYGALFGIYSISALASACPAILFVFFVRDYLLLEAWTGLFLLAYFAAGIAGMPLWKSLAVKYSPESAWAASMLLAMLGFAGVLFIDAGHAAAYLLICLASGLAFGADLALPTSILASRLAQEQQLNGASRGFACLAFLSKVALAVSAAALLTLLDLAGYQPGVGGDQDARVALLLSYGAIPLATKALALLALLWLMVFRKRKVNENNHIPNISHLDITHDY